MFGQVILLTGKRGNGKSTLGSQFVCEALRQGYNGFIYSGELPNFYVKSWIDGQIYGHSHLTNAQISECEDMYRDRLFIYNSSLIETDELDDLLTVVEDTIIKKDIKFVLLDNLMTALSAETNEQLYRRQSEFVGRLAKMTKAYNNVIMLVAHPRKSKAQFDNDDVSGTADITNRVDVVMSYDKDDKLSDDVRKLKITKNRLTGRLGEIELYFDEDSKRISDTPADFEKDYLVSKFRPSDDLPDEIPF
jgi:twinkle protein